VPNLVLGDLRAIVGTHQVGARRLREFLDDYDLADLVDLSAEIHGRSERVMRERIEALPDGSYEFGLDIDGYREIVHLHATVRSRAPTSTSTTPAPARRPTDAAINCTYNTTFASTFYPFKCALVPTIPNNEGLFRPDPRDGARGVASSTPPSRTRSTPAPRPPTTSTRCSSARSGPPSASTPRPAPAASGPSRSRARPEHGRFSVHVLPHGGRGSMRDLDGLRADRLPAQQRA
jgi:N-methylhydantoinase B